METIFSSSCSVKKQQIIKEQRFTLNMHWLKKAAQKIRHNVVFILLVMTLWFFFRSGTRPTRMLYPCQQAILVQFQTYLSSIGAPLAGIIPIAFRRQIKRMITIRNLRFAALLAVVFIVGMYANSLLNDPDIVYIERNNLITGAATSERHPHRVVSIHDSRASNWDFATGYYGADGNVDQDVIDNAFDRGIMELTGNDSVLKAWQELIPSFQTGQTITIKVNFNAAGLECNDNDQEIDALPQPMVSLIRHLKTLGFEEDDIWVYDASRAIPARYRNEITEHYPGIRFYDAVGCAGYPITRNSADPSAIIDFYETGHEYRKLPDNVVNADYFINMPIMKRHGFTGITLSFKNNMGTVEPLTHSTIMPDTAPLDRNPLVEVYENPNLIGKQVLVVGDGVYGGFEHSHTVEPWESFGNDAPQMLFFSIDPVAIDSVMGDWLEREMAVNNDWSIKENADFVMQIAENHGLGVYENWNNDVDRVYTAIDYVELDFDTLEPCAAQGGYTCLEEQVCPGNELDANDTLYCCDLPCTGNVPPVVEEVSCHNGIAWGPCNGLSYGSTLTQVRANCTDDDGDLVEASFVLSNAADAEIILNESIGAPSGNYWIVDPTDVLLNDSGEFSLKVTCTDSFNYTNSATTTWLIPWGVLNTIQNSPTSNLTENESFLFRTTVTCTGGECGNVTAILDPTFGKTDIGANLNNRDAGEKRCSVYTLNESGTITSITRYGNVNTVGGSCAAAIYNASGSVETYTLLASSALQPEPQTPSWNTYEINDTTLPAGDYVLCYVCDSSMAYYRDDGVGTGVGNGDWYPFDALFGISSWNSVSSISIYANYSTQGVKGVVPMNRGSPFYTLNQNPVVCDAMHDGDSCVTEWTVEVNTTNGTYDFFVIYNAFYPDVADNTSPRIGVTVNGSEACTLLYDTPPCETITEIELMNSIEAWYACTLSLSDLMTHIRFWKNS